jgi:3-methylcrotonyl-CoA carboxylase beta subunit
MQSAVFADKEHFGRIFYNQANLSKRGIPQIAIVMGSCTAGGAYVPAMADESIMVKQQATIFLAGPPLVKAATGEVVTAEALGGADVHCQESGVADHYAEDDQDALRIARRLVSTIPYRKTMFPKPEHVQMDEQALYSLINADPRHVHDAHAIIAQLIDADSAVEFKAKYGTTLVCVMATINQHPIGIIANNGVLFSESAQKGCHFIQLCNQRRIPLLFLQNITGFMVGKSAESGGIAKHGATLVNAVATASVDKITIIIGGSYGAGNYAMCGRAYEPNFLWAWPNSKTSVMGGEQAAQVLTQIKTDKMPYTERWSDDEALAFKTQIEQQYQQENAVTYTSARLFDDGVIDPKDTREYVAFALALIDKARNNTPGYGIFRM